MIPGGAPDKARQRKFVARIKKTVTYAKNTNNIVLFLDPTHQSYNVYNGYAWQEIGKEHTKAVSSNSGRRRLNIIGALNPVTLRPTTIISESNCDALMMELFMEEVRKEYPDPETIYIFLDNAAYNHACSVKKKVQRLGIKLIFLPPYSPNLNLIERLWKFLKKKVRTNHYYDTFEKFFDASCDFFKDIDQYRDELKTLLTLNFEII